MINSRAYNASHTSITLISVFLNKCPSWPEFVWGEIIIIMTRRRWLLFNQMNIKLSRSHMNTDTEINGNLRNMHRNGQMSLCIFNSRLCQLRANIARQILDQSFVRIQIIPIVIIKSLLCTRHHRPHIGLIRTHRKHTDILILKLLCRIHMDVRVHYVIPSPSLLYLLQGLPKNTTRSEVRRVWLS